MICKVCGRTITNEEANFCEYCGASFRPGTDNKVTEDMMHHGPMFAGEGMPNMQSEMSQAAGGFRPFGQNPVNDAKGQVPEAPMTLGNWLVIMLMPLIPVVGQVLYLVILFTWAFGAQTPPTRKNWARAMLIVLLVCIVVLAAYMSMGGLADSTALFNSLMK